MRVVDYQTEGKETNQQLQNVVREEDATDAMDSQENKQVYA